MLKNIQFKMKDGLIIQGQLEGNENSDNLVVMLHSGGYDRHERGVKEVKKDESGKKHITYYNPLGNYDYLTNLLQYDYCILRIDQRNHGQSGKNINISTLTNQLQNQNVTPEDINTIIQAEHERKKQTLNKMMNKYPHIKDIISKPPIQDLSFIQMKEDLKEVMQQLPQKAKKQFQTIDYIGTCMGTLVLGLYLQENPNKANSLTLFSPLYTFEYSFLNPPKEATIVTKKKQIVSSGQQFRLGNAVEGPATHEEIKQISQNFLNKIAGLNIPIFCIQGLNDVLVSRDIQNEIFKQLIDYRKENNINETYYAEIDGVHCLYDVIFPTVLEAYDFIESNKPNQKTR